jgi:HEAT repeat protein
LSEIAPPGAAERLRPHVEASGGQLGIELTACLAALGDADSIARLQRMTVKTAHLELVVALALARGGAGAKARSTLQRVFDSAKPGSERWRQAAEGLMLLGDARAREQLSSELGSSDASRAVAAAEVLARYNDARATRHLERTVTNATSPARATAALALARLGRQGALSFGSEHIGSAQSRLRAQAVAVIARLSQQKDKRFLLDIARMATRDPDAAVRETAMAALAAMGGQR